jgi:uncharacterized protein DUF5655
MSLDEYFSTGPPHERPVFEAVVDHLSTVGPVHVEPVSVGIFLKRSGRFAELRPMEKWVALTLSLPRRVNHSLIVRKVLPYHGRFFHTFNVRCVEDVDDRIRGWLTEAYLSSPE